MALAIDSQMAGSAGQGALNANSLTFAFTNGAGGLMVLGVSWGATGGTAWTLTSITYNGVTMTQEVAVGYDGAAHNAAGAGLFSLLNPATGSNNVVITMAAVAATPRSIEAGAMTFTGHNTTTPIVAGSGKTNFRESAGATATVTSGTTTTGNIAVAQMATGGGYSSTSQSLSWSNNFNTGSAGGCAAMTDANGTGGAIAFQNNITSDFMGMVCLEVAAAAGGATVTYPQLERGVRGLARGVAGGIARSFVRRDRIFVPAYAVLGDLKAAA